MYTVRRSVGLRWRTITRRASSRSSAGGDGGDGRLECLGYLANAPVAWLGEHLEQAYVVHVEIGVGAAGEDAGFKLELTQEGGDAFVQGDGLMVVDLPRREHGLASLWPS